jgi:hypothetical protein
MAGTVSSASKGMLGNGRSKARSRSKRSIGRRTGSRWRRPRRGCVGGRARRAATTRLRGLILSLTSLAALESATLQPFAFTITNAANGPAAGAAAILGLVAAELGRRFITARSLAQGKWPKNSCCVTTRRRNFGRRWRLRRNRVPTTAHPLRLGVLGFDGLVLTAPGLPPSRLPASKQPTALGILAVTLIPTMRRVGMSAAPAQAPPRSRSPTTAAVWGMMWTAHGRFGSQGSARGGTR